MRVGIGPYADAPSGMAVASVDTALGLVDAGLEVVLFVSAHATLPERAAGLREVVRLEPLPRPLRDARAGDALFLATKLALSRRWARALERHPVDVAHTFSPGCLSRVGRPPAAVTQAWFHPPQLGPRLRTMLPFKRRTPPLFAAHLLLELQAHASDLLGYRRADVVLATTPAAEAALRERGLRAEHVPPCLAMPTELPEREPSEGVLRIAFCAHPLSQRRKGLRFLLDALPLVCGGPLRLTLIGGGEAGLEEPIARARQAGVEVEQLGLVPRARYLEQLAARTDLLAVPSLYEEWGYALFEGLSRGVPALAFDVHPFDELVDEDTGLLVGAQTPEAVAAGIESALAGALPSPERVLESARRRFSPEAVVPRLQTIYASLV